MSETNQSLSLTSVQDALNEIDAQDISYSPEEIQTIREVKRRLEEEDKLSYVNLRFLAFTVVICKNRVEDSLQKYRKLIKAMSSCGMPIIESDEELWSDKNMEDHLRNYYAACGVYFENRQIMWIRGGEPIQEGDEKSAIRAGIVYVIAVHADNVSIREGITFVLDLSKSKVRERSKNESNLQRINQSYPLRPQAIYMAGTSAAMRITVNAIIRIASLFTKEKILQRIKFVSMEEVMSLVPKQSGPQYLGGFGGDIDDVVEWARNRYFKMPLPTL
jgi:CRAL/TRIO domain